MSDLSLGWPWSLCYYYMYFISLLGSTSVSTSADCVLYESQQALNLLLAFFKFNLPCFLLIRLKSIKTFPIFVLEPRDYCTETRRRASDFHSRQKKQIMQLQSVRLVISTNKRYKITFHYADSCVLLENIPHS